MVTFVNAHGYVHQYRHLMTQEQGGEVEPPWVSSIFTYFRVHLQNIYRSTLNSLLQMTYQNGKCLHCKSEMCRSLNFDLQGPILLVMFWIGFDCNPFSNPGFSWRIGFGSEWIGLLPKFWIGFWIVPTFAYTPY